MRFVMFFYSQVLHGLALDWLILLANGHDLIAMTK